MKVLKNIYDKYSKPVLFIVVNVLTIFIALFIKRRILVFGNDAFMQQLSTFLSSLIAIVISYVLHRLIVFRSDKDFNDTVEEASLFVGLRIVTYFLEFVFLGLFISIFSGSISTVLSKIVIMIIDYIIAKKIVFK